MDEACDAVSVWVSGNGPETQLVHSPDCSLADSWRWVGEPPPLGGDAPLDQCSEIELCPATCEDMLDGVYDEVIARFECSG